tara:strand:- start:1988 stop:2371 length:384 start_codon:yes stop_codon:yes gene_type:complete
MNEEFNLWLDEMGYDFNYTGDYELTLEEFPMVQDFFEEGRESNILTEHFSVGANPEDMYPAILVPRMHKGDYREEGDMRHFGIYESQEELNKADRIIHEWFNELERRGRKSIPLEKTLINTMNNMGM